MPRTEHRARKQITVTKARMLSVFGFRYSTTRDAYVLRLVGNHFGPVYQVAAPRPAATPVLAEAATEADTVHVN